MLPRLNLHSRVLCHQLPQRPRPAVEPRQRAKGGRVANAALGKDVLELEGLEVVGDGVAYDDGAGAEDVQDLRARGKVNGETNAMGESNRQSESFNGVNHSTEQSIQLSMA